MKKQTKSQKKTDGNMVHLFFVGKGARLTTKCTGRNALSCHPGDDSHSYAHRPFRREDDTPEETPSVGDTKLTPLG